MILRNGSAHGVIGDTSMRDMGAACFDPATGIAPAGHAWAGSDVYKRRKCS